VLQNLVEVEPQPESDSAVETPEEALDQDEEPGGWRERLRRLDERYPRLSEWLGGRLDIELPAIAASVAVHLAILMGLGIAGWTVKKEVDRQIEAASFGDSAVDTSLNRSEFQDLDQTADKPVEAAAGTFAPTLSSAVTPPSGVSAAPTLVADASSGGVASLAKLDVQRATESIAPTATMFSQNVSIKGNGAEHVGSTEGAVDRVADEILRRLEKGRTLVVWAFDASGSLQAERERLAKHIETVYDHIAKADEKSPAASGEGLLTAVVSFGQDRKVLTQNPTDDPNTIASAIRSVALDTTGIESTFTTVGEIVRKWGNYKDKAGNRFRTMIIVVTDEIGDDRERAEDAIAAANANKPPVPVYILGSQAIFARKEGRMNYTDPKTGHTYYNLPVDQGPESLIPEQIRLPYWYAGEQYDVLDSGFGPFALSRLAGATGGIYFVTRLGQTRMGFDPVAMREYKPDWVTPAKYQADLKNHPIRQAVIDAALITQQNNLPGMPSLQFPPFDAPEFKEAMEAGQALSARTEYTVDEALKPISAVSKLRDRENSRRWQAHYDLIRGRLLAIKVRCNEYNRACAQMKKDAPKFTKKDSNAWRLVPDVQVLHAGDKGSAAGKQAFDLLHKVVSEHPNTPWALLAQRELKDPLGLKWVEVNVKPIVRMDGGDAAAKKKKAQTKMAEPPPPPKL
jgi:hypothetical protein